MKESLKNTLIALFNSIKPTILSYLEKEATKALLAKIIMAPWMADIKLWLVKWLVDYVSDHVMKPAINYFFQKVGYEYEVLDGKHLLKEIKNSPDLGTWSNNADRV